MSTSLIVGFFWVVASAITAMLPMRRQFLPGIILLIAAPGLIALIYADYGIWVAAAALFAFLSMFRNPLRYFWRKLRGQPTQLPPEIEERLK